MLVKGATEHRNRECGFNAVPDMSTYGICEVLGFNSSKTLANMFAQTNTFLFLTLMAFYCYLSHRCISNQLIMAIHHHHMLTQGTITTYRMTSQVSAKSITDVGGHIHALRNVNHVCRDIFKAIGISSVRQIYDPWNKDGTRIFDAIKCIKLRFSTTFKQHFVNDLD